MIKVLVIDDSAVVRQAVTHTLSGQRDIELVGSAPNPAIAEPMIRRLRPDVLLLDIEMPGMDGLTFLRKQMIEFAIPTVICSTLTGTGGAKVVEALAAGAVSTIGKPRIGLREYMESSRTDLVRALREAAAAAPRVPRTTDPALALRPSRVPRPTQPATQGAARNDWMVMIGASTGGTQAIESVLRALPEDAPPIAIVQHMPERFTNLYAARLDTHCALRVREARDGDRMERGLALIAPGGRHMQLRRKGSIVEVEVMDGPLVNRHRPAVDVLFRSAAACLGAKAVGILLTGMGDDGARGLRQMRDAGAYTIAEDESTCVVFGMPREAIRMQAVSKVLPLDSVAAAIEACTTLHPGPVA